MGDFVIEVKSILELTGGGDEYDIVGKTVQEDAEFKNALVEAVDNRPSTIPVITFESRPINETKEAI